MYAVVENSQACVVLAVSRKRAPLRTPYVACGSEYGGCVRAAGGRFVGSGDCGLGGLGCEGW